MDVQQDAASGADDAGAKPVNLDPIARRVARRYRREALGTTRVEYSHAGNIDAVAVKKPLVVAGFEI